MPASFYWAMAIMAAALIALLTAVYRRTPATAQGACRRRPRRQDRKEASMTSVYTAPRTCRRCGNNYTTITNWSGREHTTGICGSCKTARAHDAASSARSDPGIPMPRLDGGLCAAQDPEIWQADDAETIAYAVDECLHCPIRAACLAWAMDSRERFGIWGGLTPRERERLRRRTRRAAG